MKSGRGIVHARLCSCFVGQEQEAIAAWIEPWRQGTGKARSKLCNGCSLQSKQSCIPGSVSLAPYSMLFLMSMTESAIASMV
jgi:hypothetical protein